MEPYDLLRSCFHPVAVIEIILTAISRGAPETDHQALVDTLLELAVAYIKDKDPSLRYSHHDRTGMDLSPRFQAEVMESYGFGDDPLVETGEDLLRWKFAGLRTVLDTTRMPKPSTAGLASREIEAYEGQPCCGICREDKAVGDVVKVLRCGHWFDDSCLEAWLDIHNSCPACRAKAVDEESQREVIPW